MSDLTFEQLARAVHDREPEWKKTDDVSLSFAGLELAGEVGELCNVLKKMERQRLGFVGGHVDYEAAADELGDVVICAMLVARKLGIDLSDATRRKFNKTSAKHNFETLLT